MGISGKDRYIILHKRPQIFWSPSYKFDFQLVYSLNHLVTSVHILCWGRRFSQHQNVLWCMSTVILGASPESTGYCKMTLFLWLDVHWASASPHNLSSLRRPVLVLLMAAGALQESKPRNCKSHKVSLVTAHWTKPVMRSRCEMDLTYW
jgi:hypothetical protein